MSVQRLAATGSSVVVVAAIIAGLWIIGSPAEQRLLRLDEQRANDLRQLSSAAEFRWSRDDRLASAAPELVDGRYLSRLPTDPGTGEPYEYRVTSERSFEVCASFDRPSRSELVGDFWFHESGRQCFGFDVTEDNDR